MDRLEGARRYARPALNQTVQGSCGTRHYSGYGHARTRFGDLAVAGYRIYLGRVIRRVRCRSLGAVKRERLDMLAGSARYTKRFAYYVGCRCRSASIKDFAKELHLGWIAVKEMENEHIGAQLENADTPALKLIGIDEFSIHKRHVYRIVVSDLDQPIWSGGQDRSGASMAQFYTCLGER